jgi:hypothetical protein
MPGYPQAVAFFFILRTSFWVWLIALLVFCSPALSADIIYRYVDQNGVTSFTERRDLIPEPFRNRAEALDAETLQPVQEAPAATTAAPSRTAPTAETAPPQAAQAPPFYASWLEHFAALAIPLPTRYQLGVGLTTLILVIGAVVVMRISSNPLVKILFKLLIVLMIGSAVYAIRFSGLNERISEATNESTRQTMTGKDVIGGVKEKTDQIKKVLDKTAGEGVRGVIERTKAATVGDVQQTVNEANQSTQRLEQKLQEIEPASNQ